MDFIERRIIHSEQWNSGKMTMYLFIVWPVYVEYFLSQKTVDLCNVFLVATVAFLAIVYLIDLFC